MNMQRLRVEMRRTMETAIETIKRTGSLRLALCQVYTTKGLELIGIDMPKYGASRNVVRDLICERIAKGDIQAIVFVSETWQARCEPEEAPLVDQWRADHEGSLEGSPWTHDVLVVIGSCPDGEPDLLTCEFDQERRPGVIEEHDYRLIRSRFTSNLPWPQRIEKHLRS